MNKAVVFAVVVALVAAGNCGTYETNCGKSWIGDYSSKKVAYVTCHMNGYVSHYDIKEESYSDDNCEGDMIATYQYLYRTKRYDDQTDKTNAKYNTTLESVTVKSDKVDVFTKGFTCTPEMKNGKKYDLTEISCVAGKVITVDVFAAMKAFIGTYFDVAIKFENNQATFSNQLGYTFVKSSSFWGCFQGWSLTLLIIVIVIVIAAIVVGIIMCTKGKKSLPKKK